MTQATIRGLIVLVLWAAATGTALADPPLDEDIEDVTEALSASPNDVRLLLIRADLWRRSQRPEEALADLRLVEATDPAENRVWLARAEVYWTARRFADAEAALETFVARTGGSLRAYQLLGMIHEHFDRTAEAVRAYQEALSFGDHPDVYLACGRGLETLGRLDEAAAAYESGLLALGDAIVLRSAVIAVHLRRGAPADALRHLDHVLAQVRARTHWLLIRADALAALGRAAEARTTREDALREAERVLAQRPSALSLVMRGRARLALGDRPGALTDLEEAVRRAPRLLEARQALQQARGAR